MCDRWGLNSSCLPAMLMLVLVLGLVAWREVGEEGKGHKKVVKWQLWSDLSPPQTALALFCFLFTSKTTLSDSRTAGLTRG